MKSTLIKTAVLILILNCSCSSNDPSPESALEYQLHSLFIGTIDWDVVIVQSESYSGLARFTLSESTINRVDTEYPEIGRLLLNDLVEADKDSIIYEERFTSEDKQIILQSREELQAVFAPEDYSESWQSFFETYGESSMLVAFSRVAINDAGDKAVYGVGTQRYGNDYGYILYLEKVDGEWQIKHKIETWVA